MYLTKIELNLKNKQVLRNMGNCDWMHKLLMEKGFGHIEADNPRQTLKILYYMEGNVIYVQSLVKPAFPLDTNLLSGNPKTIQIDKMKNMFSDGNIVRFFCTCNPTKRNKEGKRAFLSTEESRNQWIRKIFENSGAQVLNIDQTPENTIWGIKKGENTTHRIYAKTVTFSGALRITDGEKLWDLFCNGIGREKAYGCGMLRIIQ
jgi:CRISPR system Cascade subunit CasE